MKFRTELKITSLAHPIALTEGMVALGSCFATEIAEALTAHNLRIVCNPLGPLFNPLSIASTLQRGYDHTPFTLDDLSTNSEGLYFTFAASTRFVDRSAQALLDRLNATITQLHDALTKASRIIITFGTARAYRLQQSGEVVVNCHKEPQQRFRCEQLSVSEIVACWERLLKGVLADKQVILTLSPIRHLGDGLEANSLSKATLRLAIEELAVRCPHVSYFPAYELLMDDLRDYRLYADDLVHPSRQAVSYIVERFTEACFTASDRVYLNRIDRALAFVRHRPHDTTSESYLRGVRATLTELRALQEEIKIDFSKQIATLEALL